MTTIFASFYVDVGPEPRTAEFLSYISAGARALAAVDPGARYLVLTDQRTARKIEGFADLAVVVEDEGPLVLRFCRAHRNYLASRPPADLVIAAEPDVIANRPLDDSVPCDVGLAITVRQHVYRVNDVAYVRDMELGAWFLDRAVTLLEAMSLDLQEFWGDQIAWDKALGNWQVGDEWAEPEGRRIRLVPCATHNRAVLHDARFKAKQRAAYLLNFKGDRKQHLATYVDRHIVGRAPA